MLSRGTFEALFGKKVVGNQEILRGGGESTFYEF